MGRGTHPMPEALLESCCWIEVSSMNAVFWLLGIVLIVAWLVLWLAVKITFGAIHLLVVIGAILIILALVKAV
jgi:hypothetical protein